MSLVPAACMWHETQLAVATADGATSGHIGAPVAEVAGDGVADGDADAAWPGIAGSAAAVWHERQAFEKVAGPVSAALTCGSWQVVQVIADALKQALSARRCACDEMPNSSGSVSCSART